MKKLFFIALTITSTAFGQQVIVKKDGSKLVAADVNIRSSKRQIEFKANGKEDKISFSDLDSAVIDKKVLKRFDIEKRSRLYYVLASSKGKTLGVISSKRNRDRGGFSSVVTLYEVVVIENGKVLQELKFTQSKTQEEVQKRKEFYDIANRYFGDCDGFIKRLMLFDNGTDADNLILLNYLDNPEKANCN